MELIELQSEKPKPSFELNADVFIFQAKDLELGTDRPLTKPLNLTFERNQRWLSLRGQQDRKTTLLKSTGNHPTDCWRSRAGDYLELSLEQRSGGNRQNTTCKQSGAP